METTPSETALTDRVEGEGNEASCERRDDDEGCQVEVTITVEEGEPVLVEAIALEGQESLLPAQQDALRDAWALAVNGPFDEALHDQSKARMQSRLQEVGYACAMVGGHVDLDPEARVASVAYRVSPGPKTYVGEVSVSGQGEIRASTVLGTAGFTEGELYTRALVMDAQRAVFGLGAFGSVDIVGTPKLNERGVCTGVVDVEIKVTQGRRLRYGVGAGIQSGTLEYYNQGNTVDQWDIHLLAFVEHRNIFNRLGRIRLEERPRIIFPGFFPSVRNTAGNVAIDFGNTLALQLTQPAFIEPRLEMVGRAVWDYGPDPYDGFLRHDLDGLVSWNRGFLQQRLRISGGIHGNRLYIKEPAAVNDVSNYRLLFWEQHIRMEFATGGLHQQQGIVIRVGASEAGYGLPSSWDYVRLDPEIRAYLPLPAGIVLASRFNIGWMKITNVNDASLDAVSATLGPQRYRVRGGGANSHRGFLPGFLGDVGERVPGTTQYYRANAGGLTRWVASLELRVPMGQSGRFAVFTDMGDVNRAESWRFDHLRLAIGAGFRYLTIVGPFRFDIAALIPGAQIVGEADPPATNVVNFGFVKFAGAVHITIGEAF